MWRWLSFAVVLTLSCNGGGNAGGDAGAGGAGGLPGGGGESGGSGGSSGSSGPSSTEIPSDPPRGPVAGQKRVFVTASVYHGDLRIAGGAATGLESGDKLFLTAATAANLGGAWKAWLSAAGLTPTSPAVHAVDRIAEVGPWYRLDGTKAFNNKANLTRAPLVSVDVNENGRRVAGGNLGVWTGTSIAGRATGNDCDGWTVAANARGATAGLGSSETQQWSDSGLVDCGSDQRLYCFEQ